MPQTKIFGHAGFLQQHRQTVSDSIHACMVEALSYPVEKRFQRFFFLDTENFIYPDDRSYQYLIIEISLFAGRSVEAKKNLIRLIYQKLNESLGIAVDDIEIILYEVAQHDWGVRGVPGDELQLSYKVQV
jgi:phenylpyruvate tautomerase PptA (4-oxalocrotonate tautomerase family)